MEECADGLVFWDGDGDDLEEKLFHEELGDLEGVVFETEDVFAFVFGSADHYWVVVKRCCDEYLCEDVVGKIVFVGGVLEVVLLQFFAELHGIHGGASFSLDL